MNQDYTKLAEILFPNAKTREEVLAMYPPRKLPEGAIVTRFAPSPTGFLHIGGVMTGLLAKRFAVQSNGVFILRIEDTDSKREVEGGVQQIIDGFKNFGITIDEGPQTGGSYGPYNQQARKELYEAFAKDAVLKGKAYPCFCTAEELTTMREEQAAKKVPLGYYGEYAKYRNVPIDEYIEKINAGTPYSIRFKSEGNPEDRFTIVDKVKGKLEIPVNNQDIVMLKQDGIPTYHFAHVVDDTLMRVTHIIRGDEWLSSLPVHVDMFRSFELKTPKYSHVSPMMKQDGDTRRKLSKRKDPESSVDFYVEAGYPAEGVLEYLTNILNSNFEDWRRNNPQKPRTDFELSFSKLSKSGALFDLVKLNKVCKETIARMTAEEIFDTSYEWSKTHNQTLQNLFEQNTDFAKQLLNIERENTKKARKDIAKWSDIYDTIAYMYTDIFNTMQYPELPESISKEQAINAATSFAAQLPAIMTNPENWLELFRESAANANFAKNNKDYKESPESFAGSFSDFAMTIRIALTKKTMTPDLFQLIQVLGIKETTRRLNNFA